MKQEGPDSLRLRDLDERTTPGSVPVWPKVLNGAFARFPSYASILESASHPARRSLTDCLQAMCEEWVAALGVFSVWIAVREGDQVLAAASSFNERFQPLRDCLLDGACPHCWQRVMDADDPVVITNTVDVCGSCPLAGSYHGRVAVAVRLLEGTALSGVMCASVPDTMVDDGEWGELFRKAALTISRDLAAWHDQDTVLHSEQLIHRIFDVAPVGIALVVRGVMVEANHAMSGVTGYPRAQLIGLEMARLFAGDEADAMLRMQQLVSASGTEAGSFEADWVRLDGTTCRVRLDIAAMDPGNAGRGCIVTALDVTACRAAERDLNEHRRLLVSLLDSLPGMAYRCRFDENWTMELVSGGCLALTGYAAIDLIGNRTVCYASLIHPEDRERVFRVIDQTPRGAPFVLEYRIVRGSGEERWVWEQGRVVEHDCSGRPMVEGFILDITDRRRLDDSVIAIKRNECLVAMAGGMAHDFNNLLAAIIGNAELACDLPDRPAETRHCLNDIIMAAQRAARLCHQLQAYCGSTRMSSEEIDLNTLVCQLMPLIRSALPLDVVLETEFAEDVLPVLGDHGELCQMVMHLAVNAAEAYSGQAGRIMITTGVARLGGRLPGDAVPCSVRIDGAATWIEVRDEGCGMGAEIRSRMFDPFFSTKFTGRGMGLAAVQGIIRAHHGIIGVRSVPGKGTSIRVYLPATANASKAGETPVLHRVSPDVVTLPNVVLVVDDDPSIPSVLESLLGRKGIRVETARDGAEALTWFRQHGDEVDLVLMNLTMPGMDGVEASRRLRALRPDVPVLLTTGYNPETVRERDGGADQDGILTKPFTRAQLLDAMKAAILRKASDDC